MSEEEKRVAYCKEHNIHHLLELLATKVLVERPENPFAYLRDLLTSTEESEKNKGTYDPTQIHFGAADAKAATGAGGAGGELKKITLGTFGLDNAGKTTLIAALGGEIEPNCTPTVGFSPVRFQAGDKDICIFDLGGAANFRGIWVHYYHDCHGILYVVDSAADEERTAQSLEVLRETLTHPYVAGKPLLLLANKKDLAASKREAVVPEALLAELVPPGTAHRVVATCGLQEDEELDAGVEWLLATVAEQYETLSERVKAESAAVKAENERKRQERLAALRAEQ